MNKLLSLLECKTGNFGVVVVIVCYTAGEEIILITTLIYSRVKQINKTKQKTTVDRNQYNGRK